jgi:hypothetical protein
MRGIRVQGAHDKGMHDLGLGRVCVCHVDVPGKGVYKNMTFLQR